MRSRAFTLLEMVVAISIIAVISAFAIPAVSSLVNGPALTQGSQLLTNQLGLARQYATTKNQSIEVRLLRFRDPGSPGEGMGKFRAIQLLEVLESGVPVSLGKIEFLPQTIVFCADVRSSLLDGATSVSQTPRRPSATTDLPMPRGIEMNYDFVSFRFLPNGSTTLAANQNWFVTVVSERDESAGPQLPANFFILQIDPVNGQTRAFRPNL